MRRRHGYFALLLGLLCLQVSPVHAEQGNKRSAVVLKSTDQSGTGLGSSLQNQILSLLNDTGLFSAKVATLTLPAYSPQVIRNVHNDTQAEILVFAYLDAERVALFLFDENRPTRYVATSEPVVPSPTNRLTTEWVLSRVDRAFVALMRQFSAAEFAPIPTVEPAVKEQPMPELSRSDKAYRLFQEMSKIQDGSFYVGAHLGMARFSAMGNTASTVNFGGFGGVQVFDFLKFELGANIFSYLLLHADLRLKLPVLERYLTISVGANSSHVAALVTQNRGFNPTAVSTGQMLFGPTLSFDVPLLGASVRGDVKMLFGETNILIGTYGLAYSL